MISAPARFGSLLQRFCARALFALVGISFAFLLVEVAFRGIESFYPGLVGDAPRAPRTGEPMPAQDPGFFGYHPLFGHIGRSGASGSFGGWDTTVNRRGYRDKEHSYTKPKDSFRAVLIGDSQTWGIGVHDPDTMARVLEREFNSRGLAGIEAINLKADYPARGLELGGYGS